MKNAKHTQGEWKLKGHLQVRCQTGVSEKIIANIDPLHGDISEENIANARLIASAPELLKFAKEIEQVCFGVLNHKSEIDFKILLKQAHNAIAKATGKE